jgi:hypothetical protein
MALEIKTIDKQTYIDFCRNDNNIFSVAGWIDIYGDKIICCGVFSSNIQLQAAFYYYKDKYLGISFLHCPPFTPYNGFHIKLNSKNFATQQGETKKIMMCIADFFDKHASKAIVKIALSPEYTDMQAFVWKEFKVIPNYTYRISLDQNLEDITKQMTTERRNDINKALKDGVTSVMCIDNNIIKSVIEKTYSRKSLSFDTFFLDKIFFTFANPANSFGFVSYQNNLPIASVFCIHDASTAYYLLGGYDNGNKHSGAGALALWNAIEHSKKIGLSTFDFEGSMIVPVEKYFRSFGGQLTPYFVMNKANIILEIFMKFFKRELY